MLIFLKTLFCLGTVLGAAEMDFTSLNRSEDKIKKD